MAEHLTFNQRVWSSNLQWLTTIRQDRVSAVRRKHLCLRRCFCIRRGEKTEKSNRSREKYLRQRFLKLGIKGLMPRDAIELILGYCLGREAVYEAVNALFEKYGTTQKILNASYDELRTVDGMTDNAAALICLLAGIYTVSGAMRDSGLKLEDSEAACEYFIRRFRGVNTEQFKVCCLKDDFSPVGCLTVGRGSTYGVDVDIGEMISEAVKSGCRLCVVAHNHPGGSCRPSPTDLVSTERLVAAFKDAGIDLLDHIVVGREGAQSIFDVSPLGAATVYAKKW